jgi:hypothetical protein
MIPNRMSPNHALQRTRAAVTPAASTAFAPAAFPQPARPRRVSLSLWSLEGKLGKEKDSRNH